ncbi:hypothetical protein F4777DRAFT_575954 [Nemania sp. FL0916]|nr:hypothetical protein F4777DRAFT_575954 [Nemania sp. FL0916]
MEHTEPELTQFTTEDIPWKEDASDDESDDESELSECYNSDNDCDIATNHRRNKDLRSRKKVRKFFDNVRALEEMTNEGTRRWLGTFVIEMYNEVIPLFSDNDTSTDYQLQPMYTQIGPRRPAQNPHMDVVSLSLDHERHRHDLIRRLQLTIGIGWLFVNAESNGRYRSKWTGYEVFVDHELGLWIVFNNKSQTEDHRGWYNFDCGLVNPQSQQSPENRSVISCAMLSHSLREIEYISFDDALAEVKGTTLSGEVTLSEVEQEDVDMMWVFKSGLVEAISGDTFLWTNFTPQDRFEMLSKVARDEQGFKKMIQFLATSGERGSTILRGIIELPEAAEILRHSRSD